MSKDGQNKIYEMVTEKVVAMLEAGVAPWRKPWRTVGGHMPVNMKSKKQYRGINVLLLALQGYSSRYWLSFKQVQEKGGKVRKGEKGTPVVFWKPIQVRDAKNDDPEAKKTIPLLRYFYVWNLEQVEGIEDPDAGQAAQLDEFTVIERAEDVAAMYCAREGIEVAHGGGSAFYLPSEDRIGMPPRETFESPDSYYNTLFHECGHSTGASKRLGRPGVVDKTRYGSEKYGQEELVAEMVAAFLCAETGIDSTMEQSASYLQGWLKAVQDDPKLVVIAAAQAQNGADLILGLAESASENE